MVEEEADVEEEEEASTEVVADPSGEAEEEDSVPRPILELVAVSLLSTCTYIYLPYRHSPHTSTVTPQAIV